MLRRKAKSTSEATVVEQPPIILLTKKTLQDEGHMKDKPIEIEEDEEKAEEEATERRKDKGKEKVEEEGQELVQRKDDTSALTPGGSHAKEVREEESSTTRESGYTGAAGNEK